MPRNQNPFAFNNAFNGFGAIDAGMSTGAAGYYPGDRQFGSIVQRTIIEKWNLDSDWVKWRKGFEIYNRMAWENLKVRVPDYDPGLPKSETNKPFTDAIINSTLYKGKPYEINNTYICLLYTSDAADE